MKGDSGPTGATPAGVRPPTSGTAAPDITAQLGPYANASTAVFLMRDDAPGVTAPGDRERPRSTGADAAGRRPPTAAPAEERGVLSSLPSARPQRPSARRAAARRAKADTAKAGPERAAKAGSGSGRGRSGDAGRKARARTARSGRIPAARAQTTPVTPPQGSAIPRQGYEAESEIEPGVPVVPPSGPDLAVAVAELVGDLAQAGLTRGGRLLKDALGRLPGA
jgi:hypothetical protein